MISITIARSPQKRCCGFTVANHGHDAVCAAVSLLALNTANSIEALTGEPFLCDYNEEGGFLRFELPEIKEDRLCQSSHEATLLLSAFLLGIRSVKENYGDAIKIEDDSDD